MAEYSGRMDRDLTVPVLPRPLVKAQHRIRAQNLTGDPNGYLDAASDDGMWWQGLDRSTMKALESQEIARYSRDAAIDALWG